MSEDEGEQSWRFEVDEVGPDAETRVTEIEPGSPRAENVVFFLLGVAVMAAVVGLLVFG